MIFRIITCFLLAASSLQSWGQSNLFSNACFKHATYGLKLVDVESQGVLISVNEETACIPASTLKILTTATALLQFGSDYRMETPISYSGSIVKGELQGDVIIKGQGDPTLGSLRFADSLVVQQWAQEIQALGIKKITGRLIADLSEWNRNYAPKEWLYADLGNYYGAAFSALSYQENTYALTLESKGVGTLAKATAIKPRIPELTFNSYVRAANNTRDNAYILGTPFSGEREIVGTIPANRKSFVIKGSIPNPSLVLLNDLKGELESLNIQVSGGVSSFRKPRESKNLHLIATHESPSMLEIVGVTNRVSHNLFAESLAQLCIQALKTPSDKEFSPKPLLDFWEKRSIDTEGISIHDGCGLSPRNLVTAKFMTDLLVQIYKSSISNDFMNSLPVAGHSGTLSKFLKNTVLDGEVYAKSGSMGSVRCYAGYIKHNKKTYAFSFLVNNFTVSDQLMTQEMGKVLLRVSKQL